MLNVHKIHKSYGADTVLAEISFVVNPGERVGLIGPNGSGKSTLLRILTAEEKADSGSFSFPPGISTGYLPQGLPLDENLSVLDVVRDGIPAWDSARRALQSLTSKMSARSGPELDKTIEEYGRQLENFEALGGYALDHRIEKLLHGLDLNEEILDRPIALLSGGQRTRVGLAKVLFSEPDLLLLDEPTNHLDIDALEWLEDFLNHYRGGILIASHDRVFLDKTVTKIVAIDPETHYSREYVGNYSSYADAIEQEQAKLRMQYQDQEAEIKRLEADIHRTKMHAQSVELTTTSRQPNVRRYAKKVAAKALSREKKLERYLDADERVEKPKKGWRMNISFEETMRSGQEVLQIERLDFAYPGGAPILQDADLRLAYGDRIALLGKNGSGKSTLIRLVMGELQPSAGTLRIGNSVRIGYMAQEQETLDAEDTPLDVIRKARPMSETDGRNFLHYFLFEGDAALRPVSSLSYGERSRLLLGKIVAEGANFLVLDEPVNHLDIPSRERFEAALRAFPGTVLAAVHDRAFIRNFAAGTLRIDSGKLVMTAIDQPED